MSKIREFFLMLLSGDSVISSRRFVSLVALFFILIVVVLAFFNIDYPSEIFYGLIGLCLTPLGLTTIKPK